MTAPPTLRGDRDDGADATERRGGDKPPARPNEPEQHRYQARSCKPEFWATSTNGSDEPDDVPILLGTTRSDTSPESARARLASTDPGRPCRGGRTVRRPVQERLGGAQDLRVDGLAELNRAFARSRQNAAAEKDEALRRAAEPVRVDAETLAVSQSRGSVPCGHGCGSVSPPTLCMWPKQRSVQGPRSRPKFGARLMEDAMLPALQRNKEQAVDELDKLLAEMDGMG